MPNTEHIEELICMIKAVDIKRIQAYHKHDIDKYNMLSERYEYLTDQYFNKIKTQRETEMDVYSEEYLIKMNKGKLNMEKDYGKTA